MAPELRVEPLGLGAVFTRGAVELRWPETEAPRVVPERVAPETPDGVLRDRLVGVPEVTPGMLFPMLGLWKQADRGKAFIRRCRLAKGSGVSLHCYRYAWAERAKTAGYPERFAQEALGHNSRAVHRAYAKGALVKIPSLEDYENKIQPLAAPMGA